MKLSKKLKRKTLREQLSARAQMMLRGTQINYVPDKSHVIVLIAHFNRGWSCIIFQVKFCLSSQGLKIDGIENIRPDTQDLLIGIIYNPPNRPQGEFLDEFEQVLHSIFLSKRKCLI